MNHISRIVIITCFLLLTSFITNALLTPQNTIKGMTLGINIGNTMESPIEGTWRNPPVQEYAFDDYKNAGFTIVRIPS